MRKPETIERLYLDFDGFFAAVHQQADSRLRGRPVGVLPYEGGRNPIIIACSREAKQRGVKNIMSAADARRVCPDIVLVPQKPDLYRRAHNTLLAEISATIPIDAVKSIDEVTCILDSRDQADPEGLARRIKTNLREAVGPNITSSIGMAANRQLAKMACKAGKWHDSSYGDGLMIWPPDDFERRLFAVPLIDVPGVGERMAKRLAMSAVYTTEQLYRTSPKHMRKLWRSVNGERLWMALHGYEIQAQATERGMFGHARVLPPESRTPGQAYEISRLLLVKAARRLRRANFYAGGLWVFLALKDSALSRTRTFPNANDDQAMLTALAALWGDFGPIPPRTKAFRVGVTLIDLTPSSARQMDLLYDDDQDRRKWEAVTAATDKLNSKYARTMVSLGPWSPPKGGNVGGKISYTRIPSADDFW